MPEPFSHHALVAHGWCQGAILGSELTRSACELSGFTTEVFVNSMAELPAEKSYEADLLLAVSPEARERQGWRDTREALTEHVEAFWSGFAGIKCGEVEVLSTDEITLDQLTMYLRFDADWISFADDTATTPLIPG